MRPRLPHGAVHLWVRSLAASPGRLARLGELLDAAERRRAVRFRFARDRRRFIVGRASLRTILGAYLASPPAALSFAYGPHGKPTLRTDGASPSLHFNVAHSDDVVVVGVARRPLGVDVEAARPGSDWRVITAPVLAPAERRAIEACAATEQPAAFLRCWTRKEAYLKAVGCGLTDELDALDVSPARLAPLVVGPWHVQDIDIGVPGYAAALATAEPVVGPQLIHAA